jgi:hypothetical protein
MYSHGIVYACVHRFDCSCIYEYLYLYCVSKQDIKLINMLAIQKRLSKPYKELKLTLF